VVKVSNRYLPNSIDFGLPLRLPRGGLVLPPSNEALGTPTGPAIAIKLRSLQIPSHRNASHERAMGKGQRGRESLPEATKNSRPPSGLMSVAASEGSITPPRPPAWTT
jgi:hypothetical protein